MSRQDREQTRKLSGQRLKEVRNEVGLTQERFASLFGRNQQDIQRYETGRIQLPNELAKKIVERFPICRSDWLTGMSDIKTEGGLALESLIDRKAKEARTKVDFIKLIAKERGYDFVLYSSGLLGNDGKPVDSYIVRRGTEQGTVVMDSLIEEISDFIDYKLNRITMMGGNDNGKH